MAMATLTKILELVHAFNDWQNESNHDEARAELTDRASKVRIISLVDGSHRVHTFEEFEEIVGNL